MTTALENRLQDECDEARAWLREAHQLLCRKMNPLTNDQITHTAALDFIERYHQRWGTCPSQISLRVRNDTANT